MTPLEDHRDKAAQGETWALIPAGGNGTRFSHSQNKLLADIAGTPVLIKTLKAHLQTPSIQGIILVCSAENQACFQSLIEKHLPEAARKIHFASGGATRRESVCNGLNRLPSQVERVAVHDAARALVQPELIEAAIATLYQGYVGAVVAVPIHDTVKRVLQQPDGTLKICETLDRQWLWRAQTPQVFMRECLCQAHAQVPQEARITDDAQLLEYAGLGPVAIIQGSEHNLKITTPADIILAEAILAEQQSTL